jgi:hypothetical protein
LRHEHVVPRAKLVAEMLDHPDRIDELTRKAVACIVTPAEHDLLKPFDSHDGWDRYLAAFIDVYDMATRTLIIKNGRYVNNGPVNRPEPRCLAIRSSGDARFRGGCRRMLELDSAALANDLRQA